MSTQNIHIEWSGEGFRFTGFSPNGVELAIDGNSKAGTSPMTLLLHAETACSAIDVVDMFEKMRQTIDSFRHKRGGRFDRKGNYPKNLGKRFPLI